MRLRTKSLALTALLAAGCGGEGLVGLGLGLGLGVGLAYGWCEIDDDCYDYDYHDGCCYEGVVAPSSIATTDFDGDGNLDAVLVDDAAQTLWFAQGQSGGGFANSMTARIALRTPRASAVVVNANGDAFPDLLVLDGVPGALAVWAGDGHGGFGALPVPPPAPGAPGVVRFACERLDGDGFDDVVSLNERGEVHVGLATGIGQFMDLGASVPASSFLGPVAGARLDSLFIALGGFDDAPGVDLAVLDGARGLLALLSGRGDGTFSAPRVVSAPQGGDVLDVAAATVTVGQPAGLAVLTGSATNVGAPSTLAVLDPKSGDVAVAGMPTRSARSIVPFDLDRDGLTDFLLADTSSRAVYTLHARPPN